MLKKIIFCLLLFISFYTYSQENINHSLNISLSVKPELNDGSIPRGITINYSKFFTPKFTWGLSGRIINQDYTSLWVTGGYLQHLGNSLGIPIIIGTGIEVKNIELSDSNDEGLRAFFHAQTGINWYFDTNWSYTISTIYNYDIFDNNSHTFFINLGMTYLF